MVGSYYLYRLDNYDENYYSHIPLKDGEILARVETDNMVGGEMPLVKINILNGRVYFMSEENDLNSDKNDKNPKFNRASADVLYLSLDNYIKTYEKFLKTQKGGLTYAEGGEVNLPNGVFIDTTKTTQSKDEILEMYSNQGYTAIGGGSLLSDNFKKYNRNKDIYIIVGEIKHTSNNTMKGTIYMKKNEVAVQNFISKNTDAKVITKIPNTNSGSTYAEGGEVMYLLKNYGYKGNRGDEIIVDRLDKKLGVYFGSPKDKSKMKDFQKKEIFEYEISDVSSITPNPTSKGGFTYAEGGGVRKPRLKKGDQVYIYGKTWFQKSYGNTYHITKVYVNNEIVGISEIQYGYGEQYVQTGMDILWNNFLPPYKWKMNYSSWRLKDFGIKIQTEETEVTRERDLNHTNYGKGGNISYDVQDLLKG